MKTRAGILFIIAGILIVSWALYMRIATNHTQKVMMDEFTKAVENYTAQQGSTPSNETIQNKDIPSNIEGMIGILEIPKIELKTAVVDGVDTESLKKAVGHFKETAYPGEAGNCAISGHRSFTYSEFFNRLNELNTGDKVCIKAKNGTFEYIVYDKRIIDPDDLSVLNNTEKPEITLITCHPERSSAQRLIIKGRLTDNATP